MTDSLIKARLTEFLMMHDDLITTGTALRLAREMGVDIDIQDLDH